MEYRLSKKKFYCHSCQHYFSVLIDMNSDSFATTCPQCNSDLIEEESQELNDFILNPPEPEPHFAEEAKHEPDLNQPYPNQPTNMNPQRPRPNVMNQAFVSNGPNGTVFQQSFSFGPGGVQQSSTRIISGNNPSGNMVFSSQNNGSGMQMNMIGGGFPFGSSFPNFMRGNNIQPSEDPLIENEQNMNDNMNPFSPNFMSQFHNTNSFPNLGMSDLFQAGNPIQSMPPMFGIPMPLFASNFNSNFRSGMNDPLLSFVERLSMMDQPVPKPTSSEIVSNLPTFKIEDKHCKTLENGQLEKPTCPICCDAMQIGDEAKLITCGHMFHTGCLEPWLAQHNTCPICRFELPTE